MSITKFAFATALAVGVALPAMAQTAAPRDTGNMAYPAPVPQGQLSTTTVGRTPDTGNMAYPAPVPQGTVGTSTPAARAPDTGNMAYPAPVPQGTVGTTTVK